MGSVVFLTPPLPPMNLYPLSSKRKTEFLKSPKSPLFSYRTFKEIVLVVDLVLFKNVWVFSGVRFCKLRRFNGLTGLFYLWVFPW